MLGRIRQAFIPKDPLYRRESGAGRRVAIVAKFTGAGVVFAAYLYWLIIAPNSNDGDHIAPLMAGGAALLLCITAFVLGLQSVRSEANGGTAEALVMTPIPRRKLLASKLAGSAEFLVVAALLLPLYGFSMVTLRSQLSMTTMMHGGLLRVLGAADSWPECTPPSFAVDAAVGLAGFAGDLTWYAMFATCGMLAGVIHRGRPAAWLTGGLLCCGLLLAYTFADSLGQLSFRFEWDHALPEIHQEISYVYSFPPGYSFPPPAPSVVWSIFWFLATAGARLLTAYVLLRLAARHFDRIATD